MLPFWYLSRSLRKHIGSILLISCLLLNISLRLSAQADMRLQNFTVDDGLSNNYIRCLVQDHLGFIWIGTENGLNRFDGRRFLEFRYDVEDDKTINGNWINAIIEDQQQNLWASTRTGLNRLDRATGKFERIGLRTKQGASDGYLVTNLHEGRPGQLWASTRQHGLLVLKRDESSGSYYMEQVFADSADAYSGMDIPLLDVIQDEVGDLWVLTARGVDRINISSKKREQFLFPSQPDKTQYYDGRGNQMVLDEKGNIIVVSRQLGLFFIQPSDPQPQLQPLSRYSPALRAFSLDKESGFQNIFLEGHLLWASLRKTVGQLNLRTGAFHLINEKHSDFTFVAGSVMLDTNGNLWMGTSGAGLYLCLRSRRPFQFYDHRPLDPNSISEGAVRTMLEDNQGYLWVGLLGAGLDRFRYDEDDQLVKVENLQETPGNDIGLVGNHIIILLKDRHGQLWIGTNGGSGLNSFNPATGAWEVFSHQPDDPNSIASGGIWALGEDSNGFIWIGSFVDGLARLNPANKTVKRFIHDPDDPNSLSNKLVKALIVDKQGILWVGTNKGLNRLDPETENFTHYFHDPANPQSISASVIWEIYEDSQGDLWIGTGQGLNRFDRDTEQFERFYEEDGLPSNTIFGIIEDRQGLLWISTDNGLARRLPPGSKKSFRAFKKADGIGSNAFLPKAHYLSERTGKLFFGSTDGMLAIEPELLRQDTTTPDLVLHSFTKFNLREKEGEEVIDPFISSRDGKVTLSYWDQFVSFTLSDLSFYESSGKQYEYQLSGLHPHWIPLQDDMEMTFTSIPPGDYILKARSVSINDIPSPEVQLLFITVYPPWWKSNWAYCLYLLLAGGLIYALYQYQLNRQLKKQEAENRRALDAFKDELYTNITHEFRTPLTIISGMAEQISGQERIKNLIKHNSDDLINLVTQILDLRKMEMGKLQLDYVQGDVVLFLQHTIESYMTLAKRKEIDLHLITKIQELWMDYDRDKLLRIVANLLSNAIKFTPKGGRVYVEVEKFAPGHQAGEESEALKISVIDTGIGIPKEKQQFIFDRFYQVVEDREAEEGSRKRGAKYRYRGPGGGSGIGLALTKELVTLMGGQIGLDSTPGRGTTLTVFLPVSRMAPKVDAGALIAAAHTPQWAAALREDQASPLNLKAPTGKANKSSLLIIEDNPDLIEYLQSLLEGRYNLLVARNGEEGITTAFEKIPDLILSDVMMPGKDGFEVCSTLKQDERTSHIPIVLLTAKTSVESRIQGLERGADAYLAKPFNQKELFVRLEKLAELRQRLRHRYQNLAISSADPSEDQAFQQEDAFITKLRETVEANMENDNFGTSQLCKKIGMSRSQLHLKIKALTNRSSSNFIRTMRLKKAKELFQTTGLNVTEVSLEVGISDRSYFSRKFKEEFGVSPKDFMAAAKQ